MAGDDMSDHGVPFNWKYKVFETELMDIVTESIFVNLGKGAELNWISIRTQNQRWFMWAYRRKSMSTTAYGGCDTFILLCYMVQLVKA